MRWALVLIFALALLAYNLGLDLLLGGFAAGIITRQLLRDYELPVFESKLTAVAFGVFVPFFFIVSGMQLDVAALFNSVGGLAKLALFFVLFFVVRGPLDARVPDRRGPDRAAGAERGAGGGRDRRCRGRSRLGGVACDPGRGAGRC